MRLIFFFQCGYDFSEQVLAGTPAHGHLVRGDVIAKIQEYDARDMRNIDAQNLFRSASNRIRVVVHRDSKMVVASNIRNDGQKSRSPSAIPPYRNDINLLQFDFNEQVASFLPQTNFHAVSDSGSSRPNSRISNFSPMPSRDHQQETIDEQVAITSQVKFAKKNCWKIKKRTNTRIYASFSKEKEEKRIDFTSNEIIFSMQNETFLSLSKLAYSLCEY